MNVFIIPSWYPSAAFPYTGIFFKEQAALLAQHRPHWCVGVSVWGSHEPALWVRPWQPLDALLKLSRRPGRFVDAQFSPNGATFFQPAYTWTRRLGGNLKGIIAANEANLQRHTAHFGQPDVLHAHVAYPAGAIAQYLSRKHDIPYLITEHMSPFPLPSFRRDFRKTILPPLQGAAQVYAVSESLKREMDAFGVQSTLVPNVVDMDYFQLKPKPEGDEVRVFALGRLELQKGFDLLFRTLERNNGTRWRLHIGGSGSQERVLRGLVNQLGLSAQVHFLGDLTRGQVREEMQQCDFFVLPSRHESFGVVLLEAMACGKPVLATRCGGLTEMLPERVGKVLEPAALTEGWQWMLNNYRQFDPMDIRVFVTENYTIDRLAAQLERDFAQ